MLVFWEQRLVFLATPKTGSTAIETALESLAEVAILRPPALKHTTVGRYRRFLGPMLEKAAGGPFTVVALMREPVDWLGSWYRYRQRDELSESIRSTRDVSFDDFVTAYLADDQPEFAQIGAQARFLAGGAPDKIDRIFRYERIGSLIEFLEDRLDCEITLPRINVSPEGTTALSPEIEARLRAERAEDFALYQKVLAEEA